MCGVFGFAGSTPLSSDDVRLLVRHSEQRGRDSSGLLVDVGMAYEAYRADFAVTRLIKKVDLTRSGAFAGHSRLITNGTSDNQPVNRGEVWVFHNGIVVNDDELWEQSGLERELVIDTEIIAAIAEKHLADGGLPDELGEVILAQAKGVVACAIMLPRRGKIALFSNNGSLYTGTHPNGGTVFASESHPLAQLNCGDITQVTSTVLLDVTQHESDVEVKEWAKRTSDMVPGLILNGAEEKLLEYSKPHLTRCTRCILPDTMPYISFDADGVCNYCRNYTPRNKPRPKEELFELVEPYRREFGNDCIVPFSGGRDSCFGLHLIVKELKMKPITYTYDWGMVTDLGRRNISRMSAELGVENIIVAADITKKRANIAKNLNAWLKSPHLGMMSILTAGDKHFFKYIESIKEQTQIGLNLWGINPLEVTHFKAGFLGVPPDFEEDRVYSHGAMKQLRYQKLRLKAMAQSPSYFNSSLWDTLSGEYYRSFTEKSDYFHLFDYYRWDESQINGTLAEYDWELAVDTSTTWRIGDGTAGFYNYVYYTLAGFTEHDTFRSNQIREGDITRDEALRLVEDENQPRYANIKWYLDVLGMDFASVIRTVNNTERLYGR